MNYNRTLEKLAKLLEENGELRWLFDFVKSRKDLDFLTGKNKSKEWISVYRGLSRIITITKTRKSNIIKIDGAEAYKMILPKLYGNKDISDKQVITELETELENIVNKVAVDPKFDRYYNNKKEGYYQNVLSRQYGICGEIDNDFVIIDKEAVIGYLDKAEKQKHIDEFQPKYKKLQRELSARDPKRYGSSLENNSVGNELDFLALDKEGNIRLIEYKHGRNTSGIYLTPIQIGMYYDIFTSFPRKELEKAVFEMLEQKQKIGLINSDWIIPNKIQKDIKPILIFSDFNYKGSAKVKFDEVLKIARESGQLGDSFLKNLEAYNFTKENGLSKW